MLHPLTPTGTLPPEWGYPKEGHESEYPSAFPSLARLAIEGNNISGAEAEVHWEESWVACARAHLCWPWMAKQPGNQADCNESS